MNPQRRFGLTVGGVFLLLGIGSSALGSGRRAPYFVPVGAALVLAGIVYPALLVPVERAWMKLGAAMHVVSSTIVITAVFVLAVVPIAVLRRRLGHDPLRLRRDGRPTHWKPSSPIAPESMRRQF